MLAELRVENLLLIERAELRLAPGLNALTGETGAGKTVLAHALHLLLGGKPRASIVRPGASEAYVEGVFTLDARVAEEIEPLLPESVRAQPQAEEIVLCRRVLQDGRTRAYVNGRTVNVADLRNIGAELVAFHGQHQHRKLTLASAQLQMLDGFCGPSQQARLDACAAAFAEVQALTAEIERVRQLASAGERELDLLSHEIAEIEQADLDVGSYDALVAQRDRLRRLDTLVSVAAASAEEIVGEERELPAAATVLAEASRRLQGAEGLDAGLDALARRLADLALEARELGAELGDYAASLQDEDGGLPALEERLQLIGRLTRKHGGEVEAVLAHLQHATARRDELMRASQDSVELEARLDVAQAQLRRCVDELSAARSEAAPRLATAVSDQLASLRMPSGCFKVSLAACETRATGGEVVEFLLAPNPGVAAGPLRQIGSGGELSRTMLALASVLHASDASSAASFQHGLATIVFDEVDAGIGGKTARIVGERLKELGAHRQVLCITHLPQVASFAQRHFTIVKDEGDALTEAKVRQLSGSEVVDELTRMLGAGERDGAARKHAQKLAKAA